VKYGVSIAKPIFVDGIVLVCGYWNGSRAISVGKKGGQASLLWSEEERLRGLMAQPLHREGIIYLLDRSHGLTAFELKSGNILWRDDHELTAAGRNPHASLVWLGEKGGDALSLNAEANSSISPSLSLAIGNTGENRWLGKHGPIPPIQEIRSWQGMIALFIAGSYPF
jgi:hypothetical protein